MMNLFTVVEKPKLPSLSHADKLMLIGSCFASEMGERLRRAKFACDVNPYGVLYNPLSISQALREMLSGKVYVHADLYVHADYWHSAMHHGDFSAPTVDEALQTINQRISVANEELKTLDCLLITFGSAWVYEEKDTHRIVGNCHKLPERNFVRRRLSVEEIVDEYTSLLNTMIADNPALKIVFTVSPIRHVRDGLHDNQLSKATLLLAIDQLQHAFPECVFYFPAYELLMDELRDYRFYADDLVHPSAKAVEMVWQRFVQTCMNEATQQLMKQCNDLAQALAHRPLQPQSEANCRFLQQIMLKIAELSEKYPYLDFQNEKALCHTRLNNLQK